ncbi:MAG: C40 family peptidase [Pseudomonas sp.]
MRRSFCIWLVIFLSLPLSAIASNRHQPLPAGSTGYTSAIHGHSRNASSPVPAEQASGTSQSVLDRALTALGVRYRWGGSTPERGFDCSGLVRYAFDPIAEVDLPRTSNAMSRSDGLKVTRAELEPGDLLFFNIRSRRVNHVAIYLGNDRFIHAPRRGKAVRIDSLKKSYWQQHYALAKRVLPEPSGNPL